MKKTLVILLISPFILMAEKKLFIGVNVAPHIANQTTINVVDVVPTAPNKIISGSAGIYLEYSVLKWLYISTGINYSQQLIDSPHAYFSNNYPTLYSGTSDFEYLKLPLQTRFNLKVSPRVDIYYTLGIYYSYLLRYSETGDKLDRLIRNNDFGLTIGNGASIRLNARTYLDLGVKLDYSLIKIEDLKYAQFTNVKPVPDTQLLVLGIFLGLKYNLLR